MGIAGAGAGTTRIQSVVRASRWVVALILVGCAGQKVYEKQVAAWKTAQASLPDMQAEELLQCAGDPSEVRDHSRGVTFRYGYSMKLPFASAWCVLDVDIENGLVSKFRTTSGNPGGLTDGAALCSLVTDRCFGDGTLEIETAGTMGANIDRMRGNSAHAVAAAQSAGEQARNTGTAQALGMLQGMAAARGTGVYPPLVFPGGPPAAGTSQSGGAMSGSGGYSNQPSGSAGAQPPAFGAAPGGSAGNCPSTLVASLRMV